MADLSTTIQKIFSIDGLLSHAPWFEHRQQQTTMAVAIAEALTNRRHLIVEAPTGVGKTLAYLIPAILYALRENRKAVISTYTKNLQDQILRNDIPLVRSVLPQQFKAITLKGRRNYLCPARLQYALSSAANLFDTKGSGQLNALEHWSETTEDGDLETVGFPLRPDIRDMVCSDKDVCGPNTCGTRCFFRQRREQLRAAQVVIMNHALLFTLLSTQGDDDGYVFSDDFVIFDEAHTLEAVASLGLGTSLSRYQILAVIHKIFNPHTRKGLLTKQKKIFRQLCTGAERETERFFNALVHKVVPLAAEASRTAQASREFRFRSSAHIVNTVEGPLSQLQQEVQKQVLAVDTDQLRQELLAVERGLGEVRTLLEQFLEQPDERYAYWLELSGAKGENVTLRAAPVDAAEVLGPVLFREGTSAILTSATLAVHARLEYVQERLGAHGVQGLILDSPFDHRRQMKLRIARNIPEPDTEEFARELPAWIMRSIEDTGGRALVLFTSAALMRATAAILAEELEQKDFPLLVQGEHLPRSRLVEEFRHNVRSVLFGLESFWMGIDVPGEALEHVIITRLPFAVPSHPLTEARMALISARGGNPFVDFTLPEAVIKFRQGAGRLLRTRTDRGIVTVLDKRLLTKRYGQEFIFSLPECPVEILSSTGDVEEVVLEPPEWWV
jgi:ATP-dependent DNA helicase DinG